MYPLHLKDAKATQSLPTPVEYTKTVCIEWNAGMYHFRITIAKLPPLDYVTKCVLVFNIAKTLDVLEWFSADVIRLRSCFNDFESRRWTGMTKCNLPFMKIGCSGTLLSNKHISRSYSYISTRSHTLLHSNYMDLAMLQRMPMLPWFTYEWLTLGMVQISLVMAKIKVAPIKKYHGVNCWPHLLHSSSLMSECSS